MLVLPRVVGAGCWVLGVPPMSVPPPVLGAGRWVVGAGCSVLGAPAGAGSWVLGAGRGVLGAGCWCAGIWVRPNVDLIAIGLRELIGLTGLLDLIDHIDPIDQHGLLYLSAQ